MRAEGLGYDGVLTGEVTYAPCLPLAAARPAARVKLGAAGPFPLCPPPTAEIAWDFKTCPTG